MRPSQSGLCQGKPNIRFSRYADDWCVYITRCSREYAERLRDEIRDFLRETCGLELSAEKTRITHVRDGYDFLGFNISVGVGRIRGRLVPKVKVGRKAIANIQTPLGRSPSLSPDAGKHHRSVLSVLRQSFAAGRITSRLPITSSRLPMGWTTRLSGLTVKTICRKEDISAAKCLRRYGILRRHSAG